MASPPVLRFAPSPNGELHIGHAYSALWSYRLSERLGGRFLVRIEDIDGGRTRETFVQSILRDLDWLGITYERPVLRQSERFAAYRSALERLDALGVTYPCFATRTDIEAAWGNVATPPRDPDGALRYPGLHKGLSATEVAERRARGEACAVRIDVDLAARLAERFNGGPLFFTELGEHNEPRRIDAEPRAWGDAVLARKDTPTSYHLSVVVDDAFQGVTHVTRGLDLFPATSLHRLLQVLLGLPEPIYAHHKLIMDPAGRKLSKSARDTTLGSLREAGRSPADIARMVGLA
jgi:glutamyl-Q tRNA(Asp) synthetase